MDTTQSLNDVVNAVVQLIPVVQQRIIELVLAPAVNPEMLWIVTPLAITTLLMSVYFVKHREEELGWNSAFGNSLVLMFVTIDLYRHIFNVSQVKTYEAFLNNPLGTAVAAVVMFEGILLMFLNFFHVLPKRVMFFVSSPLPVNLIAYVAMAIVYTGVAADGITALAAVIAFVILYIFVKMLKFIDGRISSLMGKMKEEETLEEMAVRKAKAELREKKKMEKMAQEKTTKDEVQK